MSEPATIAPDAPEPRAATWASSPTAAWLVDHGGQSLSGVALMNELCTRLVAEGLPLLRVSCGMLAMHPQVYARNLFWDRGRCAEEIAREHGIQLTGQYRDSPVAVIHQGAAAVRRRLDQPDQVLDFPVLHDLRAIGATDYVAMPLRFSNGRLNYISWATDAPGGFTTAQLTLLWDLLPLLALRLEIEAAYVMADHLLTTYLGGSAAAQVLAGTIRQGQGQTIRAALWYCDLRGFTAMADRRPAAEVITTLDDYVECMVQAVQSQGGEVLKFIGDGMLAIFPFAGEQSTESACRALTAARAALTGLAALNRRRAEAGLAALRVGIALHVGEVVYGNIGAADRLDFTVIGRAVNEVCRVEALCAPLGRPLLATAAFHCSACDQRLESVGFHGLRGVKEPQELFALAEAALVSPPAMSA